MMMQYMAMTAKKVSSILSFVGIEEKSTQFFVLVLAILFLGFKGCSLGMYRTGIIFPDLNKQIVHETSYHADLPKHIFRANQFFDQAQSDVIPKNVFHKIYMFPDKPEAGDFVRARYEIYSSAPVFCLFAWVEAERPNADRFNDIYIEFEKDGERRIFPINDALRNGHIYIDNIPNPNWPDDVDIFLGLRAGENPVIRGELRHSAISLSYLRTVKCT